jgi:hypothetical protein
MTRRESESRHMADSVVLLQLGISRATKTVSTRTLSSRTVEEWIEEFRRLKKLNQRLFLESDKMRSSSLKAIKGRGMKAT